jgi:hypothetical protein
MEDRKRKPNEDRYKGCERNMKDFKKGKERQRKETNINSRQ